MSEQVGCTPTSSFGELFLAHIYHLAFSPMILLIDVSLSHLFVFLLHHISLFAILSVNSRACAHPLHECSKYQKGVDQIDLYLASGLGRVKIRFQRRPSVKL